MERLLADLGVAGAPPVIERFKDPVEPARSPSGQTRPSKPDKRWLDGLYLDQPEEMDDPYRFFRW